MKKYLFFLILMNIFLIKQVNAKSNYDADLTHQEAVLLACLHHNYAGIGVDLKDYSGNRYTYNTQIKISDFAKKEAGSFYKEHYPIYMENTPPPYTRIFRKCTNFSKSNKTKQFLRTLDLTICKSNSRRTDCP